MRLVRIDKNYVDNTISETHKVFINATMYEEPIEIFNEQNSKQLTAYISTMKYLMRKSYEYTTLMKHLKHECDMNKCGVHPNINTDNGYTIEIHHSPFVAEDIIYTVLYKRYLKNESIKMSKVIEEVMMLHYGGMIGLYPLCETCHAYVHSDDNDLFIPLENVYGDPDEFFNMYKPYMTQPLVSKYKLFKELNKGYDIISGELSKKLMKKYIYIENMENDNLVSTSKLVEFIKKYG